MTIKKASLTLKTGTRLPVSAPLTGKQDFPIIGIGASAGGLAAYEAFFSAMPATTDVGMAIVIVQHLSPDHKSILCELIKRYTAMDVHEITDGVIVKRNTAYIIPPNKDLAFINGKLMLLEPSNLRGHRLPIDFFFRSLADDQQERAICVILSGTGSDGTLGARAVKGGGGLVIAQRPESCEYDGMPQSIITNSLADYILSPEEIPAMLISYTAHSKNIMPMPDSVLLNHGDYLNKIFILIRTRTGHDFSQYKPKTILRRLERRMAINQIETLVNYFTYLQNNANEIDVLFHDFLIGVTSFFRDAAAFATLETKVISQLFTDKPDGSVIRVWIPACSTGEEAYSLAILLYEFTEKLEANYAVQIFATDIDRKAIDQARSGVFAANIAIDVSADRLSRFFTFRADANTYQIRKTIREMIVFSEQDIIKDPPFSRMDMISCRNLLIYLNTELQKKLIPMFHYSLNPNGILMLGTSESVGDRIDLFSTISKNNRIYQHEGVSTSRLYNNPGRNYTDLYDYLPAKKPIDKDLRPITYREIADSELLRQYAPAAVIISSEGDALYFHGRTGKYLEPAPGIAEVKLVQMARPGLQKQLSNAINRMAARKNDIYFPNLKVKTNGDYTTINLRVKPLIISPERRPANTGDLYIVMFEEISEEPEGNPVHEIPGSTAKNTKLGKSSQKIIAALELELRSKEEYIQTTVEEMETSTEEMKSTNEELQSTNEELQSTNEELETSREELQSVNEELATVNNELQTKIQHLSKAENDLNNLLASTGVGTIFVDLKQVVKRFTPAVNKVIKLIKSDVGRPVSDIVTHLTNYDSFAEDIQTVLDTLIPLERDVQTKTETWFLLRIMPYRTLENLIDGAVITFTDVTLHKKAEVVMREYETLKRLTAVVKDAYDAIIMLDLQGNILAWNPAATRMYGYPEGEALKMNFYSLMPVPLRTDMKDLFQNLSRMPLKPFPTERICLDGKIQPVLVTATALIDKDGAVYAIGTTEQKLVTN